MFLFLVKIAFVKRYGSFIFLLAVLSGISGYMLSKSSWIGKVGINLFYQQYEFLKIWWQAGLVVFVVLMIVFAIHAVLKNRLSGGNGNMACIILLLIAIAGLYGTYHDFRHDFSHRLLGERFHIGAYLFWISWMLISLFFLFRKKGVNVIVASDNLAPANKD